MPERPTLASPSGAKEISGSQRYAAGSSEVDAVERMKMTRSSERPN